MFALWVAQYIGWEQLTLQYLGGQLILHQTLEEQGIVGKAVTLSCTSVPTDLFSCIVGKASWCFIHRQESPFTEGEFVLQGLAQIAGAPTVQFDFLPQTLEMLVFGGYFNQNLEGVNLPSNLQSLTFGDMFNQSLEGVSLPSNLDSLAFDHDHDLKKGLKGVSLPNSLRTLKIGVGFVSIL